MNRSTAVTRFVFRTSGAVLAMGMVAALTAVGHAQGPVFRSTVDLIRVDVQVLDNAGNPVGPIGAESFEVLINGKRRKVVSADFIRHAESARATTAQKSKLPPIEREDKLADAAARTVIIAVDSGSFSPGNIQAPMAAARAFLNGLGPDDKVGLYLYPTVSWVPPTTQRASLGVRLSNLVGEKEPIHSYYNLSPHEIVDITAQATNPNSFLILSRTGTPDQQLEARALDPVLQIQSRECPGTNDPDCPIKIYSEGMMLATQLERETQTSLGGIDSLLRILAEMPGRKSVVLITGGLLVSDRLDGRPDIGTMARAMGQAAARANATIYTVQIDTAQTGVGLASRHGTGEINLARDRALLGNWLDDFSRAAGGKRIDVPVGGGDFAFDRVLRETSAYYLLGVEPADMDRDGRPHELRVKVDSRGATVRNRQWVVIPPRGQQAALSNESH